ncbi:MAG: Rieske 2Fe-2S domain-containing protein [Planctomycetes bacterium]|nr:Rieske 2Fe-2S domain-containing protein [Planctomycetota bacterium]MBI3833302.1 Rieske 2Fe-2S domain-containing protein [Planctomycetota bacterium]
MPTKDLVTKVWIEPGCIVCDACETTAPTVFEVTDDTCIIRPAALNAEFTKPITQSIIDAAEECPVDVIKFDVAPVEVSEEQAAAMEAAAAAPKPAAVEHAAPATAAAPPAAKAAPTAVPGKTAEPATATAKTAPHAPVSVAGASDPAIAALLRAASSRGGNVMIQKRDESQGMSADAMKRTDPRELPADARQAMLLEAAKKAKDEGMTRRAFMSGAALGIGWVAFGVGTGVAVGPAFGRFMMPNVLEEPDPKVRVGKIQKYLEMQPGEVNEDYKPQGIWIIREEDRIAALSIICTHLGCIPNWLPNDRKFKCPCHGSGYKPNGINFEGPTPRPLERFNVNVEDGIVIVDKSKKYQWELGQWDQPGSFIQT